MPFIACRPGEARRDLRSDRRLVVAVSLHPHRRMARDRRLALPRRLFRRAHRRAIGSARAGPRGRHGAGGGRHRQPRRFSERSTGRNRRLRSGSPPRRSALPPICCRAKRCLPGSWCRKPFSGQGFGPASEPARFLARQTASAALIFRAFAARISGFSMVARRLQRHAVETRDDVEMEMEHDLAAGRLVELLDGHAGSGERLHHGAAERLHRFASPRRGCHGPRRGCCGPPCGGLPGSGRGRAA